MSVMVAEFSINSISNNFWIRAVSLRSCLTPFVPKALSLYIFCFVKSTVKRTGNQKASLQLRQQQVYAAQLAGLIHVQLLVTSCTKINKNFISLINKLA